MGTQGKGFVWAVDEDIARDSIALPPLSFAPLLNDVELSTAGTAEPEAPSSRAASAAGDAEASTSSALGTVSHDAFQKEVQETLLRGMREGISIDNLVLEINSLKLAEVSLLLIVCIVMKPLHTLGHALGNHICMEDAAAAAADGHTYSSDVFMSLHGVAVSMREFACNQSTNQF